MQAINEQPVHSTILKIYITTPYLPSNFNKKLSLNKVIHQQHQTKIEKRKMIWFNPPYSANVTTKISNTVKPVLTTTFLKQPPVLNDHVVVLP